MQNGFELRDLPPRIPVFRRKIGEFLSRHSLKMEELDYYAGIFSGDTMLAGGGFAGNVIKCVAANEYARGLGLANTLVTHLRQTLRFQGFEDIFVFTKPENLGIFLGLAFYPVGRAESAVLLESDSHGVERFITKTRRGLPDAPLGAIVMNCNPFTLGHQYLVETAAARCKHLLVCVVEEERSFFPFSARLGLAAHGCAHLPNVSVRPGGAYIISNATFPSYFLKEQSQIAATHARLDLDIFAQRLAPALNISARFAGEEPLDPMTREYNAAMLEILPQKGVKVEIIPRKTHANAPISASRVRALIESRRLDEIEQLVPKTTFEYISAEFFGENP